ncbi:MAG: hypothetical protein COT91_01790 [Candidatus Doudnabacteria bacterium CG10_big_fil_rev_8_21_14_0_10_41_10]|uniref:Pentapeptide repeat-containing protein n=1 Tax=Candidatus Doudnabacteria bacterium CG10_big_fil_rev_8_21_14_0_10_41_10 TaxID=1974551 RepID=A0A2H0VE55_9BACT|nr:MAG: hypothetical protein COT91_01790 [Candidatus Doudnabacteria bacterium CG10_big_fil_rev_8_21_14_0_10_41_10]
MTRLETRERLIEYEIYADKLPLNGEWILVNASLSGRCLAGADLKNVNLDSARLVGTDLSGADMA